MTHESPASSRRWPLHTRILMGLIAGVVAGLTVNLAVGGSHPTVQGILRHVTEPIGTLFLRLLIMLVVPLVFSSLVVGVAGIGDIRQLGRVGLKAFGYTFVISAISVVIGLTMANVVKPGKRISTATATALKEKYAGKAPAPVAASDAKPDAPLMQVVKTITPSNPVAAAAADPANMLHVMFFALLVGVAVTLVPNGAAQPLVDVLQALFDVMARLIALIMQVAPLAVFCLLFNNTAQFGFELLLSLSWFIFAVLGGLALHMFGVYSLSVYFLSKIHPREFFRRIRTATVTAFSTSSSNATLPTAMKVTEEDLGVPPQIGNFVLTVGATANQNGTALYEGVTVLFLAQLAGVDLTLGQQITVAYLAILGGIGTAGVPSGSIPFIVMVLATINVPTELVAIILGVDRVLDMCRTTLNVAGDITAATYVARSEGYRLATDPPAGSEP